MRHLLLVASALIAAGSLAHADGIGQTDRQAAPADSTSHVYIAIGAGAGNVADTGVVNAGAELGIHVKGPLWLHAEAASGEEFLVFFGTPMTYNAGHAGLEAALPLGTRRVNMILGVDAGYEHVENAFLMDGPSTSAILVPRGGLEVALGHFDFRLVGQALMSQTTGASGLVDLDVGARF